MKWIATFLLALSMLAAAAPAAENANDLFQQALVKERTEGNLPEAIKLYQRIIDKYASNRKVAAQALLQMADCQSKLGDAQSRKSLERLVREFADQKETAAEANRRLAKLSGAGEATETKIVRVWPDADSNIGTYGNGPSPDGRSMVYIDWDNGGSLVSRDVASGEVHYVKRGDDKNFAESPAFTPDGSHIVYEWFVAATKAYELRIIAADGSGERTILRSQSFVLPAAVTPDSKFVAAQWGQPSKSQMALIALDTGEVRILKDLPRPMIGNFSADGRWLVYASRAAGAGSDADVHVISVTGSPDTTVTPALKISSQPFFTPDGSRVVFIASHGDRQDLWAVRMEEGKPLADPELVKGGVCQKCSGLGFSRDGTYYFDEYISQQGIFVAQLDPASWKLVGAPKQVSDKFLDPQPNWPQWSPDGKVLAYLPSSSPGLTPGEVKFVIRGADSSRKEVSVHYEQTQRAQNYRWLPDGKSLLLNGPPAPRALDLETGKDRNLLDKRAGGASVSRDGKWMFYVVSDGDVFGAKPSDTKRIVRRDMATGEERDLYGRTQGGINVMSLSPDGQYLVFTVTTQPVPQTQPPTQTTKTILLPTSGGDARELPPLGRRDLLKGWAPDSKELVIFRMSDDANGMKILLQPIDVGPLREVGTVLDRASVVSQISLTADGRIAYSAAKSSYELWVIKNLFPAAR